MINRTNTPIDNDENPAPKRKIIRHIVRRVPKQQAKVASFSDLNSDLERNVQTPVTKKEMPSGFAEPATPRVPVTGRVLQPSEEAHAMLSADETEKPVEAIEYPAIPELEPKKIVLDQFASRKEQPILGVNQTPKQPSANIAETGRSPIESIWPYIAAAKQHAGEVHEDDEMTSNDDTRHSRTSTQVEFEEEHNYFAWIPWVLGPIVVIALIIAGVSYFSGASVIITPKTEQVPVLTDLLTVKNGDPAKEFPLSVLTINDNVSVDVPATETKTSVATASGKVTLYNKQTVAQKLIKTTRLEAVDGKIYRIHENVLIPAAKNGKQGTLDVMVYAESSGPDYNRKGPADFTLPGFKGKPQFTLVGGTLTGEIAGGSAGIKKTVPNDVLDGVAQKLKIELENKLRGRVTQEVLPAQVTYDALYQFNYKDPVLEPSDAPEMAKAVLSGTLSVPVFDRVLLTKAVAKVSLKNYNNEDVSITRIESLPISYLSGTPVDVMNDDKVTFHIEGNASFVWKVDVDTFTRALLNVSKDDIKTVMARFPSIDHVDATLRPFWKQYFPGNVKDFVVTVKQ